MNTQNTPITFTTEAKLELKANLAKAIKRIQDAVAAHDLPSGFVGLYDDAPLWVAGNCLIAVRAVDAEVVFVELVAFGPFGSPDFGEPWGDGVTGRKTRRFANVTQ